MSENTLPAPEQAALAALVARFVAWQAGRKFVVSE